MSLADLLSQVDKLQEKAQLELKDIATSSALEELRVEWLGKKGLLTELMKKMGSLSPEDRPRLGARCNELRAVIEGILSEQARSLQDKEWALRLESEKLDVSLPGRPVNQRLEHPVQCTMNELIRIFERCGFVVELGPELEHEFYNFDALNIPRHHPARALQDTFYIKGHPDLVLRTHTSPVQIRTLLSIKAPVRMLCPGRVYRADYDATHSPMFHQIEGLLVDDQEVHMGDLKGILATMVREFFGELLKVRLRPSFFPFTEPSAEVDIQCPFCSGKGCKVCKHSGWVEIGGCGMVDPEVFRAVDWEASRYRGFAFGMGVERMTMLKYGISDLRTFYESDNSVLTQFARWRP